MCIDWNVLCSIITAIAAVVALVLSVKQSWISNKQQLFERRLKAYMWANGVISLCKDNYGWISAKREERPQLENDLAFMRLTNNSYMEEQARAIEHPLEQPFHKEFLRKREELRKLAMEFELIFKGDVALKYSEFLRAYENALDKMYQYQIIINKMKEANEEKPVTKEEAGKMFSEEKYRDDLYNVLDNLRKAYDAAAQDKIEKQLKKQLSLI